MKESIDLCTLTLYQMSVFGIDPQVCKDVIQSISYLNEEYKDISNAEPWKMFTYRHCLRCNLNRFSDEQWQLLRERKKLWYSSMWFCDHCVDLWNSEHNDRQYSAVQETFTDKIYSNAQLLYNKVCSSYIKSFYINFFFVPTGMYS